MQSFMHEFPGLIVSLSYAPLARTVCKCTASYDEKQLHFG